MTAPLAELLHVLYHAHRGVETMTLEVRDWATSEASNVLIAETDAGGATRVRWAGGGPYPKPSQSIRKLWCEPPDRVRVEVIRAGTLARAAVRDGSAWWRWDPENVETVGELGQGAALPPILDVPLLHPAHFLSTTWLEPTGTSIRAERRVLEATGHPRVASSEGSGYLELAFDREHGTPLRIATFDHGERVGETEVLSIDYAAQIDPAVFRFELLDGESPRSSRAARTRTPQQRHATQNRRPPASARAALARPQTVWLTGLSGAGKTTIANATERLLHQIGLTCCVLDGDALRQGLSSDLALTREDRREQARRAAHVAALVADSGVLPIVALISPYADDRDRARQIHAHSGIEFREVWVNTPLHICETRDPKGLYAAARAAPTLNPNGGAGLTGVSAPYEEPQRPELTVTGHGQPPRAAAAAIVELILGREPQTKILHLDDL